MVNDKISDNQFLLAFEGKNIRIPVWFMRQAGRYLPQYRELKKTRKLNEMFRDSDTAAEITLQPISFLKVDAAIMFADILTLPAAMGFKIDYIDGKGPVIDNPITTATDINRIHDFDDLNYIKEIITKVNKALPEHIPLIGFAGSPFTVLTYLMDKPLKLAYTDPKSYHRFMKILTDNTVVYLNLQRQAGIKAFQLFDTWAGTLRADDYKTFVLPYVQQIFKAVDLPSIYYLKNSAHLTNLMNQSGSDFLSVCEMIDIGKFITSSGIQGNLFNGLLYADDKTLLAETQRLLKSAKKNHKRYIFNLSHGIMPDVDPAKLKLIVEEVHKFKWF
jgi:uroporphyrinogen decarboxylase